MGGCESSAMNMPIAVRLRSRSSWSFGHPGLWWLGLLVLLLLALSVVFAPSAVRPASAAEIQPLVHFRDASHDWLLVVDAATGEVVVYDAASGRPLQRLGANHGLSGVTSITQEGSRLLVTSDRQPAVHVLKLPEFQPVALIER
jgi:hypothetical protein